MRLPDRAQAIVRALYDRHRDLAQGDDDRRRELTRMIAEQVCFEIGPSWGHKRADPGRPPSKDAIAQQQIDGRLFCWDLFNGTTREPVPNPEVIDISGQTFIEVPPVNHLGVVLGGGTTDGPREGEITSEVLQRLAALSDDVRAMRTVLENVEREMREVRSAIQRT